jgi:hypothetical protein
MASFPAQLKSRVRNTIGHTKLVPGLYRYLDYPDVATLAMPAALLIINGKKDQLFDLDGVRQCFDKIGSWPALASTTRLMSSTTKCRRKPGSGCESGFRNHEPGGCMRRR